MRKLVVSEFVTLDGVMENPAWSAPYWGDDIAAFKSAENMACDALLLGRVTYEGFAVAWPATPDDDGAFRMNSLPKHVVSTTLDKVEWNNSRLIKANIVEEITALKQQPGADILVYGSATLVNALLQHGLVDQLQLLVYPVVIGSGKRLFQDGVIAALKLVESKAFNSGVVLLMYQPVAK